MISQAIFKRNVPVQIQRVSGTYPHKDNCYDLLVTEKPGESREVQYQNKAAVDLALTLREMKQLSQQDLDILFPLITAIYNSGYQDASDAAAEEAAGEDF